MPSSGELLIQAIQSKDVDSVISLAKDFATLPSVIIEKHGYELIQLLRQEQDVIRVIPIIGKMLDWKEQYGFSLALLDASEGRDDWLIALLEAYPELCRSTENGLSLAHAVACTNIATSEQILRRFPELVEAVDDQKRTIAHYAAIGCSYNWSGICAQFPTLLYKEDALGFTLLHQAAYHGHAVRLQELTSLFYTDDDLNSLKDKFNNSPATYAKMSTLCTKLSIATTNLLTDQKSDLNEGLFLLENTCTLLQSCDGLFRLQEMTVKYLMALLQKQELMVDTEIIHLLSADSELSQALYARYFSRTLIETIELLKSTHNQNVTTDMLRTAFLTSLRFCLDNKDNRVVFCDADQRIFDTYLKSATVGHSSMEISNLLSNAERFELFHHLIIAELESLEANQKTDGLKPVFFALRSKDTAGLIKARQRLLDISTSDDEYCDLINALRYAERLLQNNLPFVSRNAPTFFDTWLTELLNASRFDRDFDDEAILKYISEYRHRDAVRAHAHVPPEQFYNSGWEYSLTQLRVIPDSETMRFHWNRLRQDLDNEYKSRAKSMLNKLVTHEILAAEEIINTFFSLPAMTEAQRLMDFPNNGQYKEAITQLLTQAGLSRRPDAFWKLALISQSTSIEASFTYLYRGAVLGDHCCKMALYRAWHSTQIEKRFWGLLLSGLIDNDYKRMNAAAELGVSLLKNFACSYRNKEIIDYISQWKLLVFAFSHSLIFQNIVTAATLLLKNICADSIDVTDLHRFDGNRMLTWKSTCLFTESAYLLANDESIPCRVRRNILERLHRDYLPIPYNPNYIKELLSAPQLNIPVEPCELPITFSKKNPLSNEAKLQIQMLVQCEIGKFISADLSLTDIVTTLTWLQDFPNNDDPNNNRMRNLLTIAGSSLIYYLLAPRQMHDSISNQSLVSQARFYLLNLIQKQYVHFCVQIGMLKEESPYETDLPVLPISPAIHYCRAPSSEFFTSPLRIAHSESAHSTDVDLPIIITSESSENLFL